MSLWRHVVGITCEMLTQKDPYDAPVANKEIVYPRIIGYTGVWFNGYHDNDGHWIKGGFEYATVEVSKRHYIVMDTLDARAKEIPEAWE